MFIFHDKKCSYCNEDDDRCLILFDNTFICPVCLAVDAPSYIKNNQEKNNEQV
jgi:hypothetical protein